MNWTDRGIIAIIYFTLTNYWVTTHPQTAEEYWLHLLGSSTFVIGWFAYYFIKSIRRTITGPRPEVQEVDNA